jgi:hypothetical protein
MNPSRTNTTLNIEYTEKESLILEISDLERKNIKHYRIWSFITLSSSFVLLLISQVIIWNFYSALVAIVFIFAVIYNYLKVIKSKAKLPYFFDTVTFYPNEIVMKKEGQVETLKLNPPYLFDLVINQKDERTIVEIENFGKRLLVFQLDNLQDLPTVTDAISDLYELDYWDFFDMNDDMYDNVQLFSYHSKSQKNYISLLEIINDSDKLSIKIKETNDLIEFDWQSNICTLLKKNTTSNIFIISELYDVSWSFTSNDGTQTSYIDFLQESNENASLKIPNSSKFTEMDIFQSALEFIHILESKQELEHVEIGLMRDSGD